MSDIKKKVLVIDFNNIWNKYLFVRKGDFSATIISILHFLKSIYKSKEFIKVYVVVDGKPCSKYDVYKEYKKNRKNNPDKYIPLKVVISVLSQYFTVVRGKNVEGDEVTAYIARKLADKYDTYIFSNDKDFIQLMQYGIKIILSFKNGKILELLSEENALNKFKNNSGVPLDSIKQVLPYRVFKGDSSDSIPPACPRLLDTKIRDILKNSWIYNKRLDSNVLIEIIDNLYKRDKQLADIVKNNADNILRNYDLMNLCYFTDDFKSHINKIFYNLDIKGLNQYMCEEYLYKWT